MRRAVVGGKAGAVHAENHRQILQANVVMDAVVGALEEAGINRHDRAQTHRRHAGGKDDAVFLGDADVVVAFRHRLFQMLHAGAAGHGGGEADDGFIFFAELHDGLAHHVLIHRRRAGFDGGRFAGGGVVRSEAVEFLRLFERGFVALALLRQNVDDNRMVARLGKFQRADEQRQIVSVNRAEIAHAHFLEQHRASRGRRGRRIR
jgi:hypothetical protein